MTFLLRRVRVGARFAIAFGVILALTLLTGAVAFIGSNEQSKTVQQTRDASRLVKYVDQQRYYDADISGWQAAYAWDTYRIGVDGALADDNPNRARYLQDRTDLVTALKSAPLNLMTAQEKALNVELIGLWDQFIDYDNRAVIAYQEGRTADAEEHILQGGYPVYQQILTEMDKLETSVTARSAAAEAHAAHVAQVARAFIIGFAVLAVVLVALMLVALVRTVVTPLRQLTQRADEVASERLPQAIAQIQVMAADATPPTLPAFAVTTKDELADLAVAFNHVQDSALDLAVEQHRADRAAAEMLVNLGRRNQNLLSRTLAFLSDLERSERDPQVLEKLFKLDHLSTRVRRNAESMLVLAGADQTRAKSRPVKVSSVVRAALAEIEDYPRVDLARFDDLTLHGSAAADITHLLAELLENATAFSAGSTRVVVTGVAQSEGGFRLSIADSGIGMGSDELAVANSRIANAALTRPDSKLLGHHVVGLLADRWNLSVTLSAGAAGGVVAVVDLPPTLFVAAPVDPVQEIAAEIAAEVPVQPVTQPVVPVAEPALVAAVAAVQAVEPVAPVQPVVPVQPVASAAPVAPAAPVVPAPAPVQPAPSVPAQPSARVRGAQLGELGRDLGRTAETGQGPQVAALPADAVVPTVPTRVRGAQLPDTGDDAAATATTQRSAEQVRRGLSGLQSGVSRARRDSAAQSTDPTTESE
ncbi:HAMP domain-containing protein [Kineococcus rhizosphaerae]|uniref:histidine kinase n=1 Tax=Kineococcus rhizosphaerae TaxID=559628 RepID=A0A2T0R076_9ACTN|nr:HAMP domain-containing protein [Kineococcus rhizosphaerae]PRY12510.1 signal transduction histidine kinase [Kineococcus rhizosphaerae]